MALAGFFPRSFFHGENDPIVNPSNGEALAAQALGRATGLRANRLGFNVLNQMLPSSEFEASICF